MQIKPMHPSFLDHDLSVMFSKLLSFSEDQHENFLRFAFKGGGADFNRRLGRSKLIQEVLERYHFKVDIKGDSLFARLEDEPKDYMLERLRILGYISVHTRQLDMVMMNPAQVSYYHNKTIEDIENYILPSPLEKAEPRPSAAN